MGMETCRKFRWFWAWQDDREEEWLGSMSGKGWHLAGIGFPGVYSFVRGAPKNYVYRLDFQTARLKDRHAYLQLFRDAGWEHLGSMSSWEYFRKEAKPGETTEIFTDQESKIEKYRRVLRYLIIFFPIIVILESTSWRHLRYGGVPGLMIIVLTAAILILMPLAMVMLELRIRRLKSWIKR